MTVNRFLLLDWDFQLKRSLPHLDAAFDGVEDIKLFTFGGQLMGVGSCADPGRGSRGYVHRPADHRPGV